MNSLCKAVSLILCAGSCFCPVVTEGSEGALAASNTETFRFYSNGTSVYGFTNMTELASWPVTWRSGETVMMKRSGGAESALCTDAAAPGKYVLSPDGAGGVYNFTSSCGNTASICIPWTVFGDGGSLSVSALAGFVADTLLPGPDRRIKTRQTPLIAYSGVDWAKDTKSVSELTFIPPSESGLEATTFELTGVGTQSFKFPIPGDWTVQLTFADGGKRTALVKVDASGVILFVR